jgi:hypothetical protein
MAKYGETIRPLPTAEVELTGDRITAGWQDLLLLVGRVAIGAIFVHSGFGKLMEISSFIPEPISSDRWQGMENRPFPTLSVISDRSELPGIGITPSGQRS